MDTSEVDDLFIEVDSKAYPNKRIYEPILENFCHYLIHGNATRFWMNQHIRKIYDISNEFSFFTSIYTAETDDKLYEKWILENCSNPFNKGLIVNHSLFLKYESDSADVLNNFVDFYVNRKCKNFTDSELKAFKNANLLKVVPYEDLLDRSIYDNKLEFTYINKRNKNKRHFVFLPNPLYIIGSKRNRNFIRLDTYNAWKDTLQRYFSTEWNKMNRNNGFMFFILDLLVESRRKYMDYKKLIEKRKTNSQKSTKQKTARTIEPDTIGEQLMNEIKELQKKKTGEKKK